MWGRGEVTNGVARPRVENGGREGKVLSCYPCRLANCALCEPGAPPVELKPVLAPSSQEKGLRLPERRSKAPGAFGQGAR